MPTGSYNYVHKTIFLDIYERHDLLYLYLGNRRVHKDRKYIYKGVLRVKRCTEMHLEETSG